MIRAKGVLIRLALTLGALGQNACESELGKCSEPEARELVYGRSGLVATKGQALMHDSCGQGAFCHSANAKDTARRGAAHGLDFDVLPSPRSLQRIVDMRDAIWEQIQSGSMPPKGFALGDSDWVFDAGRMPGAIKLPSLASEEGKAALRNWLACGAPSVTESKIPSWAILPPEEYDRQAARWTRLHDQLQVNCSNDACHDSSAASTDASLPMTGSLSQLPFWGGPCAVYRWLAFGLDACGQRFVLGGKPDESALVHKLEDKAPACGGAMPPSGKQNAGLNALVRDWIEQGAWAPQCGEYSALAPRTEAEDAGAPNANWSAIHAEIILPTCATANCHDTASAKLSGELDLSDKCRAQKALLNESGPCGKRVLAGDVNSTLIDKISKDTPRCKSRMPVGVPLAKGQIDRIRAWVEQGATAEECK